jgi:putative ABC transport system substrate-binding protein
LIDYRSWRPIWFAARSRRSWATTTIPLAFVIAEDPVRLDLVSSIARPGGNMTGINFLGAELAAKRLGFLRELVPRAARVAVLLNPDEARRSESILRDVEAAAGTMGLQIQVLNANTSREIDVAFESIGREQPDALFVATTAFLNVQLVQLAVLAAFHRLPATHDLREFAEAGGLMSYGSNIADAFRQAGVYSGRILKGVKPADLPVVQGLLRCMSQVLADCVAKVENCPVINFPPQDEPTDERRSV